MSRPPTATLPCHDALSRLARNDPQSFETLRLELIANAIDDAPEPVRLRLRQLQFRIDGIRRRSRSPLGATVKIQALMWESFLAMNDELQEFRSKPRRPPLSKPLNTAKKALPASAQIIEITAAQRRTAHGGR